MEGKTISKAQAKKAIIEHMVKAVQEGASVIYLHALATDDDETTLEDLIERVAQ